MSELVPLTLAERFRFWLGMKILGQAPLGVWMRLWIIRERAMKAVGEDGRVTLADCEALAEALYKPMPGNWLFTVMQLPSFRAIGNAGEVPADGAPSNSED